MAVSVASLLIAAPRLCRRRRPRGQRRSTGALWIALKYIAPVLVATFSGTMLTPAACRAADRVVHRGDHAGAAGAVAGGGAVVVGVGVVAAEVSGQ
ncbi:MAG: hypothetical protein IPI34_09475 [bacterium]|nr:hypothetical protein [bacterium]